MWGLSVGLEIDTPLVVKIMVPFWVLLLPRHLIFRVPKKGGHKLELKLPESPQSPQGEEPAEEALEPEPYTCFLWGLFLGFCGSWLKVWGPAGRVQGLGFRAC